MHTIEIIKLLSLPVIIYITYRVILFMIKLYEKKFPVNDGIKTGNNS